MSLLSNLLKLFKRVLPFKTRSATEDINLIGLFLGIHMHDSDLIGARLQTLTASLLEYAIINLPSVLKMQESKIDVDLNLEASRRLKCIVTGN